MIQAAIYRIDSAEAHSQIAVFKIPGVNDRVEVHFANCYWTAVRLRAEDPLLIGVYNKHMLIGKKNRAKVKEQIALGAYG